MAEILREVNGSILTLTLNRPEKQNAITREMYQTLADALREAAGDFGIRAVVITTSSQHFTSGNDLFDFLNAPPLEPGSPVMNFLEQIHNFPKPLLAAVTGNAVGIGTTMLFHCDVVVASPSTRFSMPFVNLGLVPEAGSSLLFPRLVGYQRAAKVFLTGEVFSAEFALDCGLIAEISDAPLASAMTIAEKIAAQPPAAIIQTKALLKSELHEKVSAVMRAEGELFQMALQSDEAREAFMNFLAKKGK
ncbi:MAG: enoyl-CoA hydratase [Actinobacteria bacterium]|nr:enoyl-CoA hydratase [Actinomycetota bacterium]